MESEVQRSVSLRANRKGGNYRSNNNHTPSSNSKDVEGGGGGLFSSGKLPSDYAMKIIWKKGFIRLVLVAGILWMLLILIVLLFHVWSCQSSYLFFSAICNKESKVYTILNTWGFVPQQHRCPIPVVSNPDRIVIPEGRTHDQIIKNLSYVMEDKPVKDGSQSSPLFGGHQSWKQRERSFKLSSSMKVHCGFMHNGGADMDPVDIKYVEKCRFVVASGIFDGYDVPHQPSNISDRSKELFCFLMVVDEISLNFIKENVTVWEDLNRGQWVGIWRLILLKHSPYDEPRRNGKVPKILTHRLFPQAQYSIWIDGKMELIVDPLQILERYLWRGKNTFAIAQHKHHRSIYEEADANKRRKRYARPLIDLHMKIYYYEGMEPWSPKKSTVSDVPEGAIIIREHTAMSNLFSCLWFNEVNLFTPRDQLSFGYVVYRLGGAFQFFMFPNCEYNSLFVLHPHTREHSSKVEWVKSLSEFKGNGSSMKESRGGLGLWTPYPADLKSVVLPKVERTSKAG
uniref:TOD1/MUCI70 glycosyltransferase-like domain-containing protein n=1 Tax=Populus davidiana TaxID=266767 RepID=A0A6M2EGF2_9ROSI